MTVLSASGTYYATASDGLVRIVNNASVVVVLPRQGAPGQEITIQDASGASSAQIQDQAGQINLHLTNFERVTVSWDNQRQNWFI